MISQLDWLIYPSPHIVASFTVCGENTSDLMTANSMYTVQYYYHNHCPVHQIPELIHLVIKSLHPLTNISLFHPHAHPCKHCSTLCFCKFDFFRFHVSVRSHCICHSLILLSICPLPGEGNGNPLQYSCLENSMDRGHLVGYSPWGRKELATTEYISTYVLQVHQLCGKLQSFVLFKAE